MFCFASRKLRSLLLAILAAATVGVVVTPSTVFTAGASRLAAPTSAGIGQPARLQQAKAPEDPNTVLASDTQTEADQQAVEEFWTDEQMANALPADIPLLPTTDSQTGTNTNAPDPPGPQYLAYSDENGQPQVRIGPPDSAPPVGGPQPLAGTFPFS